MGKNCRWTKSKGYLLPVSKYIEVHNWETTRHPFINKILGTSQAMILLKKVTYWRIKNVHKRKYISVNEMHAHTNWDFWRDRHTYRSRQEGTVNAQVCRRLQSRDEEIVLSTTLIKLVHLHKKFLMLTFRSSSRTSFQGRGGEGGPLYLALTGMRIFVS